MDSSELLRRSQARRQKLLDAYGKKDLFDFTASILAVGIAGAAIAAFPAVSIPAVAIAAITKVVSDETLRTSKEKDEMDRRRKYLNLLSSAISGSQPGDREALQAISLVDHEIREVLMYASLQNNRSFVELVIENYPLPKDLSMIKRWGEIGEAGSILSLLSGPADTLFQADADDLTPAPHISIYA